MSILQICLLWDMSVRASRCFSLLMIGWEDGTMDPPVTDFERNGQNLKQLYLSSLLIKS